MNRNDRKNGHVLSTVLFCIGVVLSFIGFIFPGWVWLLNTPGDVEMLPLAAITLVGIVGVVTLVVAIFRRVYETRCLSGPVPSVEAAITHDAEQGDEGGNEIAENS